MHIYTHTPTHTKGARAGAYADCVARVWGGKCQIGKFPIDIK